MPEAIGKAPSPVPVTSEPPPPVATSPPEAAQAPEAAPTPEQIRQNLLSAYDRMLEMSRAVLEAEPQDTRGENWARRSRQWSDAYTARHDEPYNFNPDSLTFTVEDALDASETPFSVQDYLSIDEWMIRVVENAADRSSGDEKVRLQGYATVLRDAISDYSDVHPDAQEMEGLIRREALLISNERGTAPGDSERQKENWEDAKKRLKERKVINPEKAVEAQTARVETEAATAEETETIEENPLAVAKQTAYHMARYLLDGMGNGLEGFESNPAVLFSAVAAASVPEDDPALASATVLRGLRQMQTYFADSSNPEVQARAELIGQVLEAQGTSLEELAGDYNFRTLLQAELRAFPEHIRKRLEAGGDLTLDEMIRKLYDASAQMLMENARGDAGMQVIFAENAIGRIFGKVGLEGVIGHHGSINWDELAAKVGFEPNSERNSNLQRQWELLLHELLKEGKKGLKSIGSYAMFFLALLMFLMPMSMEDTEAKGGQSGA